MKQRFGNQRGFLDIQLNAVLVISAILGGAALLAGIAYINTAKTEALHTGHRQIVDDLRKSYRNAENFSGLSTDRTVTLKAVPRAWIRGNAIENNLGGAVTVSPATVTNSNDSFEVEHAGLNESECNGFVNAIWPESISISVSGSVVKRQGDVNLDVGALATACNNASNTVAGVYSKF
jgi:hypothetical protein